MKEPKIKTKEHQIRELLEQELAKLNRRRDEDDELFDSEYTNLYGSGVNCSEADLAIRPIVETIFDILDGKEINTKYTYE
jgi:hypothetical protein